jgi:hypothetical protein
MIYGTFDLKTFADNLGWINDEGMK